MAAIFRLPHEVPVTSAGIPYPGAKASIFLTGTNTLASVWTDKALTIAGANPIVADAAGVFPLRWLDESITYKLTLTTSADVLIFSEDPAFDPLVTLAQLGAILYPRTAVENTLSVTPTATQYPQLDKPVRYGPIGTLSASNFKALSNRQLSIRDVDPAAGTGSAATDTAAIIAAASQLGQIGTIYFPYNASVGYSINPNAITFAGPIRLKGEGRGFGSWLIMNGFSSGDRAFTWDAGGSFIIGAAMQGFYVTATNNNGSLIKLTKVTGEFSDIFTEGLLDFCDATQGFSSTFTNIKTRNNRRYSAILRDASNDIVFDRCDFDGVVNGAYGIYVVGGSAFGSAAVTARNSRFEGFSVAGSHPIVLQPATGEVAYDFIVRGCYFEGSHDEDILSIPTDTKGVRRLTIEDNSFFGSATSTNPIVLKSTQGASIRRNRVNTYTTTMISSQGGNAEVYAEENTLDAGLTPYTLASGSEVGLIYVNNNIDTTGAVLGGRRGRNQFARSVVTYSASMTIDASLGNEFDITATNGTAFTINAPSNATDGHRITITIRNTSGGAIGVITWNAVFKINATAIAPATGTSRSIDFRFDGTNWVELMRTAADIPN